MSNKRVWFIGITIFTIVFGICGLEIDYLGGQVIWRNFAAIIISLYLLWAFFSFTDWDDILAKPERFLKMILYCLLYLFQGIYFQYRGEYIVFSIVGWAMTFIAFVSYGTITHPECFRNWADLKKIDRKVILDILKI